jgi:hypothetical protein
MTIDAGSGVDGADGVDGTGTSGGASAATGGPLDAGGGVLMIGGVVTGGWPDPGGGVESPGGVTPVPAGVVPLGGALAGGLLLPGTGHGTGQLPQSSARALPVPATINVVAASRHPQRRAIRVQFFMPRNPFPATVPVPCAAAPHDPNPAGGTGGAAGHWHNPVRESSFI